MGRLYTISDYIKIQKRFLLDSGEMPPAAIIGNGPSAKIKSSLPQNCKVFRMNFFFLQEEPYHGTEVDGYFFSVNKPIMIEKLMEIVSKRHYHVSNFFSPFNFHEIPLPDKTHQIPKFDHWSLIANNPFFARYMMERPFPTQGFQSLATLLVLGFKDIYITGIDLYSDPNARYSYDFPKEITDAIGTDHVIGGFEEKAHTKQIDISFAEMCKALYPDVKYHILNNNLELKRIFNDKQ